MSNTKELDQEAAEGLEGLYRRYASWLDRRLRAHVDADQAADVVQDTYLRVAPYRSRDIRPQRVMVSPSGVSALRRYK